LRGEDYLESPASEASEWAEGQKKGAWTSKVRHAVGIALLLATVLLWTASNFLASVRTRSSLGWGGRKGGRKAHR
jgi:solute carrier family 35 protein F5